MESRYGQTGNFGFDYGVRIGYLFYGDVSDACPAFDSGLCGQHDIRDCRDSLCMRNADFRFVFRNQGDQEGICKGVKYFFIRSRNLYGGTWNR